MNECSHAAFSLGGAIGGVVTLLVLLAIVRSKKPYLWTRFIDKIDSE